MFETLEAIRKYPLEAKRRLVGIVTLMVVVPIFIAWLIWFISYLPEAFTVEEEEAEAESTGVEILPPYSN